MSSVPDITEAEQWAVETTLKERWPDRHIKLQLADVEIKLYPPDLELTVCPDVFREVGSTSFVNIKVPDKTDRNQIYYLGVQQCGTGKTGYDDTTDRVVSLFQVHTNREARDREEST
jgi:hypothetical protein